MVSTIIIMNIMTRNIINVIVIVNNESLLMKTSIISSLFTLENDNNNNNHNDNKSEYLYDNINLIALTTIRLARLITATLIITYQITIITSL